MYLPTQYNYVQKDTHEEWRRLGCYAAWLL
jgi:hypothetical protein